jgi:gamma-glutamylputrescine oxidase
MKFEVFWKNPSYKINPELKEDISCDYLIVGGGITGVSLAYFLSRLGAKNIVLIDKKTVASGATGKAAGTLVIRGERDLSDLVKRHGFSKAVKHWAQMVEGLEIIKSMIKSESIPCEAEAQDTLYCGFSHKNFNDVRLEYSVEKKFDKNARLLEGSEFLKELNTKIYSHGLLSHNHGLSVNPLMLTQNLSKVLIKKYGLRVYENTSFIGLIGNNIARTHKGNISFKKIIMAVDSEHPSKKVMNLKSTIIITRSLNKKELKSIGLEKKKIVFDSRENYRYLKITKDNRLLAGFGGLIVHKSHKKIDPHFPHLENLKLYTKKLFPSLNLGIDYAWSGSFGFTNFDMPLIESEGNKLSISGAGTQVECVMAASFLAHKLLGKKSKFSIYE